MRKRFEIQLLSALILLLFLSSHSFSATRGVSVTHQKGQSLLYFLSSYVAMAG